MSKKLSDIVPEMIILKEPMGDYLVAGYMGPAKTLNIKAASPADAIKKAGEKGMTIVEDVILQKPKSRKARHTATVRKKGTSNEGN